MLQPKRTKFRKVQRGRMRGLAHRGNTVAFGEYGLKATTRSYVTARQIEAARRAIVRHLRRGGQVWIRIFPDRPYTQKPLETRQGGGKGAVEEWVATVRPGRVMFEIGGVAPELAQAALARAAQKLPVLTKTVSRDERPVVAG